MKFCCQGTIFLMLTNNRKIGNISRITSLPIPFRSRHRYDEGFEHHVSSIQVVGVRLLVALRRDEDPPQQGAHGVRVDCEREELKTRRRRHHQHPQDATVGTLPFVFINIVRMIFVPNSTVDYGERCSRCA